MEDNEKMVDHIMAKKELLEAFCGYLPYGVHVSLDGISGRLSNLYISHHYNHTDTVQEVDAVIDFFGDGDYIAFENFKLMLRPMEHMTESEKKEYEALLGNPCSPSNCHILINWLNSHFFDFRGLIARGVAIKARLSEYGY